jgi:C-terminal processing protease CtpA/Prc
MGPRCLSSNESFLLMMKQVPHCTLVGERSYGSSGNPKPHRLANGVMVKLPSWKALRPDGTCFEKEGISPDILVPAPPAAFANGDPVLVAALRALK